MEFLNKAKRILSKENATCVIINKNAEAVSKERGIFPVLAQLEMESNILNGACVADKVVGKSAALLFVYGGVKEVYAGIISEHAAKVLEKYGVSFIYDKKVSHIINRKGDDMCPMEKSVLNIEEPEEAYLILCKNIKKK